MSHQNSALLKFKWPCTCLVEKKTVTVRSVEAALREYLSLHSRNVDCESLEACNEYISIDDKFRGSWSVNLIFQDGMCRLGLSNVLGPPSTHFRLLLKDFIKTK